MITSLALSLLPVGKVWNRETGADRMPLIATCGRSGEACGKAGAGPTVWLWALCLHGKSLTFGERSAVSRAYFGVAVLFYSKPPSHILLNTL